MKKTTLLFAAVLFASVSFAKIWRVNNNPGVTADFTNLNEVKNAAAIMDGDTIHLEPSATSYGGIILDNKRLVFIGAGYFLDPGDATFGGNSGLQYSKESSQIDYLYLYPAAAGSKFMGLTISGSNYIYPGAAPMNITFEKCFFPGGSVYFTTNGSNTNSEGFTFRKCFFYSGGNILTGGASGTASNLVVENCIFFSAYVNLPDLTGTGNLIRNNSWYNSPYANNIANAYVANNIFDTPDNTFTNATIKNNLFKTAQPLPGTATGNQVNVNMANVYVGGSGALDTREMLKAGSPANGAGVTISGYTPDAGAFGATDPYTLSGIPAIPSIYSLTVPTSIPTGSNTMNITFSSRNNN